MENKAKKKKAPQSSKKKTVKKKNPNTVLKAAMTSLVVIVVMFIIMFAYAGYLLYFQTGIYDGITVGGIDVAGMSKTEASKLIESETATQLDSKIVTIELDGEVTTITSSDAGAYFDTSTCATQAYKYGRTGSASSRLGDILKAKFAGVDIPVNYNFDQSKLEAIGNELEKSAKSDFRQSSFEVKGTSIVIDKGASGLAIEGTPVSERIIEEFTSSDPQKIVITTTVTNPDPINLSSIKASVEKVPVDATLTLNSETDEITITDSADGISFDITKAQQLLDASDGTSITVPLTVVKPNVTRADLEKTIFTDTLAEISTTLNKGNKPRTTNVQLACDFVNGVILMPGEEFSYNDVVGERTYERGFKDAKIYVSGEVVDGVGGGICQVSSTLYMAALRSDLEITSRRNHRFVVDYTPLGEDATVVYGNVDFKFRNNTDYPIKIICELNDSQVDVKFLGYKNGVNKEVKLETVVLSKNAFETVEEPDESVEKGKKVLKNSGYTGYKTETYRVVYIDGAEVSRTLENKSTYTRLDKKYLVNPEDYAAAQQPAAPDTPAVTEPTEPVVPSNPTEPDETVEPSSPDISEPPEWLQGTVAPII